MSSFPLFNSFPPEIQSLVLDCCPPNDRVCLSLASKSLSSLAGPSPIVSLDHSDEGPLCGCLKPEGLDGFPAWQWRSRHRNECHLLCWTRSNKHREAEGRPLRDMARCRSSRNYGRDHCECFSLKYKLHSRLRSWIPRGLNYCRGCNKFTKRKKQHNGRCYHGQKPRSCQGNFWTHRSGRGAFGRKLWKKWFNNRAMNSLECRLRSENTKRTGTDRYSLRKLEPKPVDTRHMRENSSRKYPYYRN